MSSTTTIEWTRGEDGEAGASWNPVTGCAKVSPGCAHCYAETFAERFRGVRGHPYEQGFDLTLWPERLELPLSWKRPRLVFVNSMSDLFHEDVPEDFIRRVFDVMVRATRHRFQLLTKRSERLAELAPRLPWPDHVWMGVSIENRRFIHRADYLREVPSAVRFISAEPLLGPLEGLSLDGINWLIVGGESGPGARPMHPAWARDLRDECTASGVAFFFKQWGAHVPEDQVGDTHGGSVTLVDSRGRRRGQAEELALPGEVVRLRRVGKSRAGRMLDGRTWDQLPQARPRHRSVPISSSIQA
jgi:protein gp37